MTKDVQFAAFTSVIKVQTPLSAPGDHFFSWKHKEKTFLLYICNHLGIDNLQKVKKYDILGEKL